MFAEKHYPDALVPEQLDAYLEQGWYRMGQSIFTTHFLCFGEQFYSAVWIRLALQDHAFSKSMRKLLRRNGAQFRTEFRRSKINSEQERLYQRYRSNFPGVLAPTLRESLHDGEDLNLYHTWSVQVYDGARLIATSFFDIGHNSAASIMGIYDPDYSRHSLGFYTMLCEVAFCQQNKLSFFYPGYVVPGYPRFDYKARIGQVDYFHLPTRSWIPFASLAPDEIPINKMEQKLQVLQAVMKKQGIPTQLLYYPLFEANLFAFWQTDYFDFPVFLLCYPKDKSDAYTVVVFDVRDHAYHLLECVPLDDLMFYVNDSYTSLFDRRRFFLDLIVVKERLLHTPNPEYLPVVLMGLALSRRLK
ncbi:MAG TPA: arginine-tRNA-protein transferase [Saprospiraceae bacterium]|nr:arginine-tRNA-protein transferase [Saprospiraceae bacterium]HMP23909.1 arginine-tRNA-protein transferase [Saprospiraceae bacterium]